MKNRKSSSSDESTLHLVLLLAGVLALLTIYWWATTHVLIPDLPAQAAQSAPSAAVAQNQATKGASQGLPDSTTDPLAAPTVVLQHPQSPWVSENEAVMTRRGTFGDMFGAANALFSALAFACVFYAMLLQRRDLRLQRDEMDQNQRLAVIAAKLQGQATMAGTLFETIRLSKAGGGGGEIEKELREQLKHRLEQIDRLLADLDQEQDEERAKPSV